MGILCNFIQLVKQRETETKCADLISLVILPPCLFILLALPLSAGKYMSVSVNTVIRPFSRCRSVCVSTVHVFVCGFPVCPSGTLTVGLSADQKGPCVGWRLWKSPPLLACLRMCSSLGHDFIQCI